MSEIQRVMEYMPQKIESGRITGRRNETSWSWERDMREGSEGEGQIGTECIEYVYEHMCMKCTAL